MYRYDSSFPKFHFLSALLWDGYVTKSLYVPLWMGPEPHFMKKEIVVTRYIKNLLMKILTSHCTDTLHECSVPHQNNACKQKPCREDHQGALADLLTRPAIAHTIYQQRMNTDNSYQLLLW